MIIILHKFNILHKKRKELEEETVNLENKLKNEKILSIVQDYRTKIKYNKDLLKDYTNNITLNKYLNETSQFFKEENLDIELCKFYVNIASKYINIELLKKNKQTFSCKGCKK